MSEVSLHKLYSDEPGFGDFFSLLKPRVMSLVVFTAIAGLLAAPGNIHPFVAFVSIVFIFGSLVISILGTFQGFL